MSSAQDRFASALLDPARPVPAGLRCWNGSDPALRFAVYRNNVISSLIDALADNCPVVLALVGDEFFRAMTAMYVRRAPPRSPILAHYGAGFADFIADFEPARSLPYLADVARLETARMRALHAADVPALGAAAAQAALADPARLAELRLHWHPSVQPVDSAHAAVSLWAAHQTDGEPELGAIDLDAAEHALVLRDGLEVLVLPMPAGATAFVHAGQAGRALGTAAGLALQTDPAFDLAITLGTLLRHGAVTSIQLPRSPAP